jgi:hypothetical protein
MAIWYTDYLTGNDTTGDGTIATPYKTVNKAMTVGTNGDEIRVAGSGFTALAGTVTCSSNGLTTWTTSVNQTGIINPGDIITVNDAEFGDQKFFYKVQTVAPTTITVDGAWNRTPNVALTFSKITTQHYYTTTANTTFENVSIAGKTNFKITGGWTSSFTAQDGWTVMNYQGASSTAKSGTGFTGIQGGNTGSIYFDRFMLSHLNTGFGGSTSRWFMGTLAFVYFTGTSPYGAAPLTEHGYGVPDLYLTNSVYTTLLGASYSIANDAPQQQFGNIWYANTASPSTNSPVIIKTNNFYGRSMYSTGLQGYGITIGGFININNLYIATQGAAGTTENIVLFGNNGGSNSSVYNNIEVLGNNLSGYKLAISNSQNGATINFIKLDTKKIEDFALAGSGFNYYSTTPIGYIKDIEGDKQVYNSTGIAFADNSVFDTGTNSLRLSKLEAINSQPTRMVIDQYFNSTSTAKTITIRAKASASTTATVCLMTSLQQLGNQQTGNIGFNYKPQTISLTTSWQDFTYTQLDASTAALFINSFIDICVVSSGISANYIWIDSVTVS